MKGRATLSLMVFQSVLRCSSIPEHVLKRHPAKAKKNLKSTKKIKNLLKSSTSRHNWFQTNYPQNWIFFSMIVLTVLSQHTFSLPFSSTIFGRQSERKRETFRKNRWDIGSQRIVNQFTSTRNFRKMSQIIFGPIFSPPETHFLRDSPESYLTVFLPRYACKRPVTNNKSTVRRTFFA